MLEEFRSSWHSMHLLCHPLCQLLLFIGTASPLFILHHPNSFAERSSRCGGRRGLGELGVTCCASTSDDEGPSPLSYDASKLLPRLYVQDSLSKGSLINLSQEQCHYLTNVMRILKKKGKRRDIRIFNGKDGEWLARVLQLNGDVDPSTAKKSRRRRASEVNLAAESLQQLRTQDDPEDDIGRPWVLVAPLKKQQRMKFIVEKCTELGAGRIVPVSSDRMEAGALSIVLDSSDEPFGVHREHRNNLNFDRLNIQAVEASEQCERLSVPVVTRDTGLADLDVKNEGSLWQVRDLVQQWSQNVESRRKLLVCRERGTNVDSVIPLMQALEQTRIVAFLLGPEGGWSPEEEDLFDSLSSNNNIQGVSLGPNVLRAETASMLAVGGWTLSTE